MRMRFGSLFAGIGGLDLGLERAGMTCAWQVEIDDYAQKVLTKHWPDVPKHRDVRAVGSHNLSAVGLICGGFPCQDISGVGKRAGITGNRSGLWSEYARIICELRPRFVLVENVAALLERGMGRVLGDLAKIGYDAEWQVLSACAFGASHARERLFIIAYPQSFKGIHELWESGIPTVIDGNPDRASWGGEQWSEAESKIRRVDDGLSYGARRITALGNAVVPQIAEWIGRRIIASAFT